MTDEIEPNPIEQIPQSIKDAYKNGVIKASDIRPNIATHLMSLAECSIGHLTSWERIDFHKEIRAKAGELALLLTGPLEPPTEVPDSPPITINIATGEFL